MNFPTLYFLDTDKSGHWYVVKVDNREEWAVWKKEKSSEIPEFAKMVPHHSSVEFFGYKFN